MVACKSALCVFSISLFWTLYHVYALKCVVMWEHVSVVYVGFFYASPFKALLHVCTTPRWKKKEAKCAYFFNLYISNRVRSQQMSLWCPSRRPHNVDRHSPNYNFTLEEEVLMLICTFVSQIFLIVLFMLERSSSQGPSFPHCHSGPPFEEHWRQTAWKNESYHLLCVFVIHCCLFNWNACSKDV